MKNTRQSTGFSVNTEEAMKCERVIMSYSMT